LLRTFGGVSVANHVRAHPYQPYSCGRCVKVWPKRIRWSAPIETRPSSATAFCRNSNCALVMQPLQRLPTLVL
jgi:hypothetical protein